MPKLKLYTEKDTMRASGAPSVTTREPGRSAYRKDYARLLHAPAFRRLQGKTQLFPGSESDFFRNRLTHSLEVAQIAAGIAEALNATSQELTDDPIDTDLVQFASIAHDLGHPPFGHNGEYALDELMREYGGFEGNAQTLRILTFTEKKLVKVGDKLSHDFGLDLTFRTLASVLKYDNVIKEVRKASASLSKGYYKTEQRIVELIKQHVAPGFSEGKFKTLECSIMDLADDIAYSTYDLEDSLHAGFVTPVTLLQALFKDTGVRAQVLNKTNEALAEQGYEKIDDLEMLDRALHIFDLSSLAAVNTDDSVDDPLFILGYNAVKVQVFDQKLTRDVMLRTKFTADRIGRLINAAKLVYNQDHPSLSKVQLSREALLDVEILKHLNFELVIRSPRLAVVEYRGKDIVKDLFRAIISSGGDLLSGPWKIAYKDASTKHEKRRVACEFISGMTDSYAVEFHNALFGNGKNLYKPI